jgi:RNA polymerase sigma-70 factor (ECF subfamily)
LPSWDRQDELSWQKNGVMNHLTKKVLERTCHIVLPLLVVLLLLATLDTKQDEPPPELPTGEEMILEAVKKAQAGDEMAFTTLYRSYHMRIYYYLLRMVGNPEDASDLAAETFAKAWHGISGILDGRRFNGWLYSIATRTALDHLRRRKRDQAFWGSSEEDTSDEHTVGFESMLEEQELVQLALKKLAPKPRACLLLQIEGFSQEEIAIQLGLRKKSVGTYVSMARKEFRKAYRQLEG